MAKIITLPVDFDPRWYQVELWKALQMGVKRADVVWHRRAGKDLNALHMMNWFASTQRIGTYWHVLPTQTQAKKIVWQGATNDGKPFLDAIPRELRKGDPNQQDLTVKINCIEEKDTFHSVSGEQLTYAGRKGVSTYQLVGGDNFDRLVGTNPVGIIFSEWSLTDPDAWDYIAPILEGNDGWAVFIYTPRGRNHAWRQREDILADPAKSKYWYHTHLTAFDTGFWKDEQHARDYQLRNNISDSKMQQEFLVDFDAENEAAVYANELRKMSAEGGHFDRFVPWDPTYPVATAWDLGSADATAIWFIQEIGNCINVIDYYENRGRGMEHYAKVLKEKDYYYAKHYLPHDAKAKIQGGEDHVKSRVEHLRAHGIKVSERDVVERDNVEDGIEAVRLLLPRMYFDRVRCARGIDCIKGYSRKYNKENRVYGDPIHDWHSHAADAMRTYAMGRRPHHLNMTKRQELLDKAEKATLTSDYDPYKY